MILTRLIGIGQYRAGFLIATPRQPWVVWDGTASRALPMRFKIVDGELRDPTGLLPVTLVPSFVPDTVIGKKPEITPRNLGYNIQIINRGRTVATDYWEVPFDPTDVGVNWHSLFTSKGKAIYPEPMYLEDPRLTFATNLQKEAEFNNYETGHIAYVEEDNTYWGNGETQWVSMDISSEDSTFIFVSLPQIQVTSQIVSDPPEQVVLDISATLVGLSAQSEFVFIEQTAHTLDISATLNNIQIASDVTANAPGEITANILATLSPISVSSDISSDAPVGVDLDVAFQTGLLQVGANVSVGAVPETQLSGSIQLPISSPTAASTYAAPDGSIVLNISSSLPPLVISSSIETTSGETSVIVTGEPLVPTVGGGVEGTLTDPQPDVSTSGTIRIPINNSSATATYDTDTLSVNIAASIGLLSVAGSMETMPPSGLSGSGTEADPYLVSTASDLELVRNNLSAHYLQTANINLNYNTFIPIGKDNLGNLSNFTGVYNGGGYVISNLKIDELAVSTFTTGLFGFLGGSGTVRDLGLLNVDIVGGRRLGGIAGASESSSSLIQRCFVTGSIFSVRNEIGGIIGYTQGIVEDCWTSVLVETDGSVTSTGTLAGVVGHIEQTLARVRRCYALGTTRMATGAPTPTVPPQAVVSAVTGAGSTPDNTWDTDISNNATDGGNPVATGRTTVQMKTATPFSNWDTTGTVWVFEEDRYPRLTWQAENTMLQGTIQFPNNIANADGSYT